MRKSETVSGESALSYVSGVSDRPLLYRTVDGVLKAAVGETPDHAGAHRAVSIAALHLRRIRPARSSGLRAACSPADSSRASASASGRRIARSGY